LIMGHQLTVKSRERLWNCLTNLMVLRTSDESKLSWLQIDLMYSILPFYVQVVLIEKLKYPSLTKQVDLIFSKFIHKEFKSMVTLITKPLLNFVKISTVLICEMFVLKVVCLQSVLIEITRFMMIS